MKLLGIFIVVIGVSVSSYSFEDFGSLALARKTYPEIFIPGSVNTVKFQSNSYYVFSGEAEQCFSGEFVEPESELYEEATLSAKNNFFEFLTKGGKTLTISMSQCSVLYRFNDRKVYTVILFVPVGNVVISQKTVSAPETPKKLPETLSTATVEQAGSSAQRIHENDAVSSPKATIQPASPKPTLSSTDRRINKNLGRLKNDPNDVIAYSRLAELYQQNNDFENAIKNYRRAIQVAGKSEYFDQSERTRMILQTALLCEKQGKNNLALKYYYLLLKNKCSKNYYDIATARISQIRLKMIE